MIPVLSLLQFDITNFNQLHCTDIVILFCFPQGSSIATHNNHCSAYTVDRRYEWNGIGDMDITVVLIPIYKHC